MWTESRWKATKFFAQEPSDKSGLTNAKCIEAVLESLHSIYVGNLLMHGLISLMQIPYASCWFRTVWHTKKTIECNEKRKTY